jgi:alpha-galactosidase
MERDRSNGEDALGDGRTLTLRGTQFAKGLGVHAASDVRFTVPAGCTASRAPWGRRRGERRIGRLPRPRGRRQAFDSGVRTRTSSALPVSVPVTAGSELRLVVTDAGDGIGADHADWADAKLSCDESEPPPPPPPPPAGRAS